MIEEHLLTLAPQGQNLCDQAVRYALLGGGKRFRPHLTLAVTEALNGSLESALTPACALEMVHAYSMIHDDLPCMDNDDFRRGKPTVHKAFPEGIAVLAGDWLLTEAFSLVSNHPKLTAILAQRSKGMIRGQVLDLEAEGSDVSLEALQEIHRYKTGQLIIAAAEFGSVIATGEIDPHFQKFAEHLGLAFQIVDDILDVTQEKHGRKSDADNGKATYVSLLGLDGAALAAERELEAAEKALPIKTAKLEELMGIVTAPLHTFS